MPENYHNFFATQSRKLAAEEKLRKEKILEEVEISEQKNSEERKTHIGETILQELNNFTGFTPQKFEDAPLVTEPFIAYAETDHGVLLFCRGYTPSFSSGIKPLNKTGEYASYLAPIGILLSKKPGETWQGLGGGRAFKLYAKSKFIPQKFPQWDATNGTISLPNKEGHFQSILSMLNKTEQTPQIKLSVELESQPVLDPYQDEIFRSPFNKYVRISGGPGTGKTTTMLKRLAQKTKQEFLSEEEKSLYGEKFVEQDWILFTPSDLLKTYIEKALAKEQLPSGDEHVKIYGTLKRKLLREVGVIKMGKSGEFPIIQNNTPIKHSHQILFIETFEDYLGEFFEKNSGNPGDKISSILREYLRREKVEHEKKENGEKHKADLLPEFIRAICQAYSAFKQSDTATLFFKIPTTSGLEDFEQDILLLVILKFVKAIIARGHTPSKKTKSITELIKTNICIDEVTDFSPLEIACMKEFADPKRGGVTVCGDLMQRTTPTGLQKWSHLDLVEKFKKHELLIGYRQTYAIFQLPKTLYETETGQKETPFQSHKEYKENDPPPIIWKPKSKSQWVNNIISEIFEACQGQLPTIAILTPNNDGIESFAEELFELLRPSGIEVETSPKGQNLGNPERVRVFPIEQVKGLEFEAVIYLDIDKMAEIHKDLITKYLYVGLSRARSFLAISYHTIFPKELECIKPLLREQETFA